MSTTAVGDDTEGKSRVEFMLTPTNSGWTGSAAADIAQLDCSVSAASCGCVHSVALYLLVVMLHLLDSDIERDLPYLSSCWRTLLLCLLLPLLILQHASCSPGITDMIKKTPYQEKENHPGADPGAGSNGSRSKSRYLSVPETRNCNLTTRR